MRMLLLQQATPGLERESFIDNLLVRERELLIDNLLVRESEFFIDDLLVRERQFFVDNLMVRGGEEEADASAAAGHPRSKPWRESSFQVALHLPSY